MLANKLKDYKIVLASSSPRRQEIFKELNIPFTVKVKHVNEHYPSNLKGMAITNYLAKLKAKPFENELNTNEIVITADTIVWLNNNSLEKPKNEEDAVKMLSLLSGKMHEVITSVCIKTINSEKTFSSITKVYFKELSENEINYYVEKYHPLDKAGAYGIQEWIGFIGVTKLEGSYFNVMGLPIDKLYEELINF
ncbi:MAG: Maf-like protein [Lutibacter sp.]|uniref:Maf-like protein n=1 Tax=Lutibacter sp. TaxID=1925666 RepID=UPI00299E7957|nr:Maf-like protein [Lutibacter sp.]MDX1828107.1 Maf-like protein [Lutibacter sp.]